MTNLFESKTIGLIGRDNSFRIDWPLQGNDYVTDANDSVAKRKNQFDKNHFFLFKTFQLKE